MQKSHKGLGLNQAHRRVDEPNSSTPANFYACPAVSCMPHVQVPLAAPDSLQEGEPPRTTPRQASRPHPLWGELSGPSGLHRFHRPAVHARMLAPGLGMGYGLGALNASVAASATAANEAAANGHCGSQGTSAHGMSSPLRAFKAGRGINTEQDQGPAGTVMDRPRTLLPRSLL